MSYSRSETPDTLGCSSYPLTVLSLISWHVFGAVFVLCELGTVPIELMVNVSHDLSHALSTLWCWSKEVRRRSLDEANQVLIRKTSSCHIKDNSLTKEKKITLFLYCLLYTVISTLFVLILITWHRGMQRLTKVTIPGDHFNWHGRQRLLDSGSSINKNTLLI